MKVFQSAHHVAVFQSISSLVGISIVVVSTLAGLVGEGGLLLACGVLGGIGWVVAAFLPPLVLQSVEKPVTQRRQIGLLKGKLKVPSDFDTPLPADVLTPSEGKL